MLHQTTLEVGGSNPPLCTYKEISMEINENHWDQICMIEDFIKHNVKPYVQNPHQLSKEDLNHFCQSIAHTIAKLKKFKCEIKHHSYPEIFDEEGDLIKLGNSI